MVTVHTGHLLVLVQFYLPHTYTFFPNIAYSFTLKTEAAGHKKC
jgi:hypothetical protein